MTTNNQVARRQQHQQAVANPAVGIPAWLAQIEQDMQAQGLEKIGDVPDMGGARIPQVSVDGGVFSLRIGKDDPIPLGDGTGMMFAIVRASGKYEPIRRLYDKEYDPDDTEPGNIICWSNDAKVPDASVMHPQSPTCQNCPVFKQCGGSWPALVWIMDDNYTGPARWNMNFNTRRNAPVLPTINRNYHPAQWFAVDQLLDMLAKTSSIGTANIVLRAEHDKGRDVVKGKIIVSVIGPTPADHLQAIKEIEPTMYDAVFNPIITQRAAHEIEGEVAHAPQQAQRAPSRGPAAPVRGVTSRGPAQARGPAPARHADVEDAQVVEQAPPRPAQRPQAPRPQAPAQAQAPRGPAQRGVPPGTEDDFAQAPARGAPARAPARAPAPTAPAQAAPAPARGPAPFAGRGPARPPSGPLAGRTRNTQPTPRQQQPQQGYETMDDAGSDGGYDDYQQ